MSKQTIYRAQIVGGTGSLAFLAEYNLAKLRTRVMLQLRGSNGHAIVTASERVDGVWGDKQLWTRRMAPDGTWRRT